MMSITLNHAACKGQTSHFTCGIAPSTGKWGRAGRE